VTAGKRGEDNFRIANYPEAIGKNVPIMVRVHLVTMKTLGSF
jgi:hypothetical protein